ncbi:FAD binding domain protein [Burkholderia cenocepacia]|uniref:FAD binding domain protein n=1 Tax=Burkholderia cenocepacia TaxID=95486 RepID=A0AAN0RPK4_9BURK|nr:FAD binding domain protein [Burkholderia cenocepacia]
MNRPPARASVLVIGSGPCGLVLALELGRRGISTVLIDKKSATAVNPQANATQARTMEYYRRLGFSAEIRALGLPLDYPTDIAYFTRYTGYELARFSLPSSQQANTVAQSSSGSWSTPELPHRVSQKFVERVLRRHAEAVPSNSLHYGWQLVSFSETVDTVTAVVENVETGERCSITADYLIGADGARSTVRRQLGIRYGGETGVTRDFFGGKMVAVYLRAPQFYDVMPHGQSWMYWAFNPQRRSWLAAVNGRDEFAFHTQLKSDEDQNDLSHDRGRTLFYQAFGRHIDVEILAVDTWTAGHALVAESFGRGRVYISGDAAHLFTPAGGLGYNTAVEDAINLGWKLAAAVKQLAGPSLLQSYAHERRRLAIRNTGYARQFANEIGNFVPHPDIECDTPGGEAARKAAGVFLGDYIRREFNIPGITFGGRYDDSPVIVSDGAPAPEDAANQYEPSAVPGGRAPHVWLEDGRSLYDLFGFDWNLLVMKDEPSTQLAASAFVNAAHSLGLSLTIVDLPVPQVRELYEADLAIVRPDQIVAWRGSTASKADAESVFRVLTGHTAIAEAGKSEAAIR